MRENKRVSGVASAILTLFVFCLFFSVNAQMSMVHQGENADFRNAMELFEKEKFLPAQKYFSKAIASRKDVNDEIRVDAAYYHAICAIELFHENAALLLQNFIHNHPESPHVLEAYFNLAKYQFRKKRYSDVLEHLAAIDPLDLKKEEKAEYHFKKGYSHFELEEYDAAATEFYEIKDTDNPYVMAARYYYAHISYQNKKYETAAVNFLKIDGDPQFGPLAPYYLTQIYFKQGKYQQLVDYAPAVLDSAPPKRESEIRKLIGNSYYELANYKLAIPYLQAYLKEHTAQTDDYYQLGFALFEEKKYEESIENFQKAIADNDTIAQSAYYHIGQASVFLDQKEAAKNAFRNAYRLEINKDIAEDALFNYAKIAYELASHPYDNAILAFEEYINKYPNSTKISDAYEYLLGVYYTTKNYKEALLSLERIENKNVKLLEAKQRIAHYRGVELFREEDYKEAINLFRISRENNLDPKLYAASLFWIGESFFRLEDYDNANDAFARFLSSSGAMSLPIYNRAYYNMAYANFKPKKYKSAIFWFREYTENAKPESKGLINDSYLRIGDAYFIQKDYRNAIEYYDKAAQMKMSNQDYALLQSALAYGVLGEYESKNKKLLVLSKLNTVSVYQDDALFELGKTSLILNKNEDALAYYNQLINQFPKSPFMAEAYLKVGLINYNKNEDELALFAFDKVIKDYPNSNQATEALEKIRTIFIDKADAEGFEQYISGVPFADISKSKLDSTSYVIAENNYLNGNCEKATRDFSNYLNRYPDGIFSLNAHYYRAECELKAKFEQEAAKDYQYVVDQPSNKFTEKALLSLGRLYVTMGKIKEAEKTYGQLVEAAQTQSNKDLAYRALMDLNFELKNYQKSGLYANKLLAQQNISKELFQQAHLILARSSFEREDYDNALEHLDSLVEFNSTAGAEAKYMKAKIYYLKGEYLRSDTVIYQIVDQVPSSPYWIAKGFILLADNFISKGDYYNARITFQSVIDNADNEELIGIAKEKLAILVQAEELKDFNETEPIEIIMNEENVKDESIFEVEEPEIKNEENEN